MTFSKEACFPVICVAIFVATNTAFFCIFGSNPNYVSFDSTILDHQDQFKETLSLEPDLLTVDSKSSINPLPPYLELLINSARSLKIYVSRQIKNNSRYQEKYPGTRFHPSDTTIVLNQFSEWFWVHDEYQVNRYMVHRSHHDTQTFTEEISQAHLCYPTCDNISFYEPQPWQVRLKLQVTPHSQTKFAGCKEIVVGIETQSSTCSFAVPYWHSIYAPTRHTRAPWNSKARRENILCFIGGSWRGTNRSLVIAELRAISDAAAADAAHGTFPRLFSAPFYFQSRSQESGLWGTSEFFARVWSLYARSVFSWQPSGDTGTRRGVYDSWMLGCIPVISRTSARVYRSLFRGRVFEAAGVTLEDVAVVLDDAEMQSGAAILANLTSMPQEEIRRRRSLLALIAPALQWGYDAGKDRADALLMTLASALTSGGVAKFPDSTPA